MSKKVTVSICEQADRESRKIPEAALDAFMIYLQQAIVNGGYSSLTKKTYSSVDRSIIQVSVKGRPAGRMYYTTAKQGHVEILAFATKSRNGQDPKIKSLVEKRFKDFKAREGIR